MHEGVGMKLISVGHQVVARLQASGEKYKQKYKTNVADAYGTGNTSVLGITLVEFHLACFSQFSPTQPHAVITFRGQTCIF